MMMFSFPREYNSGETKDAEERKCSRITEMGSAVNNIYLVT